MANAAPPTRTQNSVLSVWQTLPAVRWGTLALVLGVYAIASLEPFDWQIPRQVPNHAERTRDGWKFAAPGIVIAPPPHDWLEPARAAETFTLSLLVRSHSAAQSGPARIATMSWDTHMRNLTLAQENARSRPEAAHAADRSQRPPRRRAIGPRPECLSQRALVVDRSPHPSGAAHDRHRRPARSRHRAASGGPPDLGFRLQPRARERDDLRPALARRGSRSRGQGARVARATTRMLRMSAGQHRAG